MHSLQTNELTENEFQHNFYGYKITEILTNHLGTRINFI